MTSILEIAVKLGNTVIAGEAKHCNSVFTSNPIRDAAYHWDESSGRLEFVRKVARDPPQ